MTTIRPVAPGFQKGEAVIVARGTYPGTRGVFLGLREDQAWADIEETNGGVRSHPVVWLDHVAAKVNV